MHKLHLEAATSYIGTLLTLFLSASNV